MELWALLWLWDTYLLRRTFFSNSIAHAIMMELFIFIICSIYAPKITVTVDRNLLYIKSNFRFFSSHQASPVLVNTMMILVYWWKKPYDDDHHHHILHGRCGCCHHLFGHHHRMITMRKKWIHAIVSRQYSSSSSQTWVVIIGSEIYYQESPPDDLTLESFYCGIQHDRFNWTCKTPSLL